MIISKEKSEELIESKFELKYLQNIWNREHESSDSNFMKGQTECANHSRTIIGELMTIILTERRHNKLPQSNEVTFTLEEVRNMIGTIYSEFAETTFKQNHITLQHIIKLEIEKHPLKPVKIFNK